MTKQGRLFCRISKDLRAQLDRAWTQLRYPHPKKKRMTCSFKSLNEFVEHALIRVARMDQQEYAVFHTFFDPVNKR